MCLPALPLKQASIVLHGAESQSVDVETSVPEAAQDQRTPDKGLEDSSLDAVGTPSEMDSTAVDATMLLATVLSR